MSEDNTPLERLEDEVNQAIITLRRRELLGIHDTDVDESYRKSIEKGLEQLNRDGEHFRWKLGRLETDLPAGRWHPVLVRNLRIDPDVRRYIQAADHVGQERQAEKLTMDDMIAAWPVFREDPTRWTTSGGHLAFTQPLAHAHIVGSAEEAASDTLNKLLPIHLYLACLRLTGDAAYELTRKKWEQELSHRWCEESK